MWVPMRSCVWAYLPVTVSYYSWTFFLTTYLLFKLNKTMYTKLANIQLYKLVFLFLPCQRQRIFKMKMFLILCVFALNKYVSLNEFFKAFSTTFRFIRNKSYRISAHTQCRSCIYVSNYYRFVCVNINFVWDCDSKITEFAFNQLENYPNVNQ